MTASLSPLFQLVFFLRTIYPVRTGGATGQISQRFDFSSEVTGTRCHEQQRSRDWLDEGVGAQAALLVVVECLLGNMRMFSRKAAQLDQLVGMCEEEPYQRLYALQAEPELI